VIRPESDAWRLRDLGAELTLREADLRNREVAANLVFVSKPDWVFHLATHGAYSSQTEAARIYDTTFTGTVNLLEAALRAGFEAFVNSGSSSEYGYKDHAPAETEALEPNSDYAVAKAAASMYCAQSARAHGAHVVTLRLYSAYGPWEEPTRLIPVLLSRGLEGEVPPLVNPEVARDFVHVDDVVEAYLLAAQTEDDRKGSIYNVASGTQTTIADAVETARRLLGVEAEPQWGSMGDRKWDTDVWVGDPSLITERLGWSASRDIEAGFAATIDWLQADRQRLDRYLAASAGRS
jgi:nucleoside-diphosphate-sugar epimerase